jgi:hypothetical protein
MQNLSKKKRIKALIAELKIKWGIFCSPTPLGYGGK